MRIKRRYEPGNADERAAAWLNRWYERTRPGLPFVLLGGVAMGAAGFLHAYAVDLILDSPVTLPATGGALVLVGAVVALAAQRLYA